MSASYPWPHDDLPGVFASAFTRRRSFAKLHTDEQLQLAAFNTCSRGLPFRGSTRAFVRALDLIDPVDCILGCPPGHRNANHPRIRQGRR